MNYKKITFACVLLGLSLYAGVCAATVREMADEAPVSKQTIIADKKDKKLLIIVISLFTVRRLPARRRLLPIFWRLTRL